MLHTCPALDAKNYKMEIVVISFIFNKYQLIIDYLGLKYLSRKLEANCIISYFFNLYLMFNICALRFDVTEN